MNPSIIVRFNEKYEPLIKHIRKSVFTLEQNVPEALDFEGKDPGATHALVRDGNRYVGTGRMLGDGHIGRVAVLKEYRKRGFGKDIIAVLIEEAGRLGIHRVFLGAQLHAVDFYKKCIFLNMARFSLMPELSIFIWKGSLNDQINSIGNPRRLGGRRNIFDAGGHPGACCSQRVIRLSGHG